MTLNLNRKERGRRGSVIIAMSQIIVLQIARKRRSIVVITSFALDAWSRMTSENPAPRNQGARAKILNPEARGRRTLGTETRESTATLSDQLTVLDAST